MYQITIPTRIADFNFERGTKLIDVGNPPVEYSYIEQDGNLIIKGDTVCLEAILSLNIRCKVKLSPKTLALRS